LRDGIATIRELQEVTYRQHSFVLFGACQSRRQVIEHLVIRVGTGGFSNKSGNERLQLAHVVAASHETRRQEHMHIHTHRLIEGIVLLRPVHGHGEHPVGGGPLYLNHVRTHPAAHSQPLCSPVFALSPPQLRQQWSRMLHHVLPTCTKSG